MKIKKFKINGFGKLKEKEIVLSPHINLIYGKNESGKSTLLKYITGMLYGISKNKNGKSKSDQERYTPWNQGDFSGKLEYELDDGTNYEVFRDFAKKKVAIYNDRLEDISQEFRIDKTKGNSFFEEQTGVEEELFCSTILSQQGEVRLEEKEQSELIQKMSNIIGTGEDTLSFQKIIAKLNKRQTEQIGSNRTQDRPINITEKRIREISQKKEQLQEYQNKKYEIEEIRNHKNQELEQEQKYLEMLKQIKQLQEQIRLEQEKQKVNVTIQTSYEQKIQELNQAIKEETIIPNEKKKKGITQFIGIGILFILSLISIFFLPVKWIGMVFGIFTIAISVYFWYKAGNQKQGHSNIENIQKTKIDQIKSQIEVLQNQKQEQEKEVKRQEEGVKQIISTRLERISREYTKSMQEVENHFREEFLEHQINDLQERINENRVAISTLFIKQQEAIKQLEELSELEEEEEQLKERYEALIKESNVITIAKEEIQKAYEQMKETITPKFTQNLSKTISSISNNKYEKVHFDEQKGIIVEVENGEYLPAEELSMGTIDQLYLSLRLGAGKEISKESMPILLDEAFAYYDEERLSNILQYLNTEYADRQIIIFTCSNREKEQLEQDKIAYTEIQL